MNSDLILKQAEARVRLVAGKFDSVRDRYSSRFRWIQRTIEQDDIDALIRGRGMLEQLVKEPSVRHQLKDAHDKLRSDPATYNRYLAEVFGNDMAADTRVYERLFRSTVHGQAASLHSMISEYLSQFRNAAEQLQVTDVVLTKPPFNLDERLDHYFCHAGIKLIDSDGVGQAIGYYKIKNGQTTHYISLNFADYPLVWRVVDSLVRDRLHDKWDSPRINVPWDCPQMMSSMISQRILDKFPTPREIVEIAYKLQKKGFKVNIETIAFSAVPRKIYEAVGLPLDKASYYLK